MGGDVARATAQVFNWDVGINTHVRGGARHKLGETVGPNRAGRGDVEATFLLDQSLKQTAPLRGRQPCARHTRRTRIFRGDLYDHHLDGFAPLPKEARIHRMIGGLGIDLIRAKICIAFKGCNIKAGSGDGSGHLIQDAQLVGFQLFDGCADTIDVVLHAKILKQAVKD